MRLKPFHEIRTMHGFGAGRKAAENNREPIRQWLLSELMESYFYPAAWLKQRLQLIDRDEVMGVPEGFFGFSLLTVKDDPFLWFSIEPADAAEAEGRLREILRSAPFSRLGVSTDGTVEGTRVLRQRSNSEESDFVPDLEPFNLGHTPD